MYTATYPAWISRVFLSINTFMHAVYLAKNIVRNLYSSSSTSDSKCMLNIYFIDFH